MSDQALSPPFEFPIERGKILEFARAIGSENPSFFGPGALAPPTFLMVAGQIWGYAWERPGGSPLAREGVDASRTLHLEESYRFVGRPLRAGDVLQGQLRLLPPVEKASRRFGTMTIYTTETIYRRPDASEAAHARQVIACPHGTEAAPAGPATAVSETPPTPAGPMDDAHVTRRFGPLRLEDFVRYQAASGDLNPYHYDPDVLAAAGGTQLIAPGMLPAGILGGLVADTYGADRVREISFRFLEPLPLGHSISCRIEPADEEPEPGETALELTCTRGDGALAIVGAARILARGVV